MTLSRVCPTPTPSPPWTPYLLPPIFTNILLFPMFLLQNKRITQMKTCQWFLLSQDIQPLQGITHTLALVMVDIPMLGILDILTLVMALFLHMATLVLEDTVIHSTMDIHSQATMVLDLCLLMDLELIMKKTENICWTISHFLEEK